MNPTELAKVPYLKGPLGDGRRVPLMAFWDGNKWAVWIPTASGELISAQPLGMAEGSYFAREAERKHDLYVPFVDFLVQRAYWPSVVHWVGALEDDLRNLATSLAKIDFFFLHRAELGNINAGLFVATEIEYIAGVCRSMPICSKRR